MFASLIAFASDNLYADDAPQTSSETVATTVTSAPIDLPSSSDLFLGIISNLNYFLLAWSIYYTVILFMNFYYWRLYRNVDRLHHEAKGVKSIQDAWWIWFRYIHVLLLLTMVINYKEFGILVFAFLFYFIRAFLFKLYSNYANVLLVLEVLAIFVAIFTIRSDFTFMRSVFAFLFIFNVFWIKLRWDFVNIMESLGQGFGQIGWKDNWPAAAAKFTRSDKLPMEKDKEGKIKPTLALSLTGIYTLLFFVTLITVTITSFM
jgi:hypothetical protein